MKGYNEVDRYIQETSMLDYSDSHIQKLIQNRGWLELSDFDCIKAIYNYVRDEILFGYNIDDSIPASKVLADGYGQCNTKGTLFMALLRACNIPCRVHGFTIDKKLQKGAMTGLVYRSAPKNVLHSWVEVFFEDIWYAVIADKSGASTPNLNKVAQKTYVTWDLNEAGTEYVPNDTQITQPENWYDYENGKWANIKTTNETEGLEAYWVWIPRYEYKVPEVTQTTATQIDVRFIGTDKKEGAEGYTKQSDGTIKSSDGYTIHPAFTNAGNGGFGELDGIWVAKFEAVSNTPTASNGGGNATNLKVQVIPNQPSWRYIQTTNIFTACRKMTNEGEVLEGSTVDSHMMKNTEWGAVAILSQSKYGVFNPESSTGANGDATYQVWNNSSSSYITGSVGTSKDAKNTTTFAYNSANGPKASTTGTVYGVYDMAGGSWEYVAGCLNGQENAKFGVTAGDTKYVDLYTNTSNSNSNYDGAKIGDATKETKGWNSDYSSFVDSSNPVFTRGR